MRWRRAAPMTTTTLHTVPKVQTDRDRTRATTTTIARAMPYVGQALAPAPGTARAAAVKPAARERGASTWTVMHKTAGNAGRPAQTGVPAIMLFVAPNLPLP